MNSDEGDVETLKLIGSGMNFRSLTQVVRLFILNLEHCQTMGFSNV